jgi:hypothetical protein
MAKEDKNGIMVLRKVGVLSLGKIMLIIGAIYGFIGGLFIGAASTSATASASNPFISILGWWAVLALPVIYGIAYFVSGIIGAWIYNLVAAKIGGVQLHLGK